MNKEKKTASFESDDYMDKSNLHGSETAGIVYGNVSNASTLYGQDKFATPRGHGFAAEQANHLHDKIKNFDFLGKDNVKIVGDDNIKNGADRLSNGKYIQTKYCKTGGKCVSECFENGKFRYLNNDGTPMQIEVPSDKYEAAVQAMKHRIENGEVPGVSDPNQAIEIIKEGKFTYQQAKNIAKAGTVESITFDAVNGAIVATSAFGLSAVLTFATETWNGQSVDVALQHSVHAGLKVGGTTLVTAVISGQLSKAGLNSALVGSSEAAVRLMGPKTAALIANAFRSGQNIYGAAAMKSVSKMLRSNFITAAVSFVVLSTSDVSKIFRGRISGKQLFKNLTATGASIAGGTAGWVAGAAQGAALGTVVPVIGNTVGAVVGGLIGSFIGGTVAQKATETVVGVFIEDDAVEMVRIIENKLNLLVCDYLLTKTETEKTVTYLQKDLDGKTLQIMFASDNREQFANDILTKHIITVIADREKIVLPPQEEFEKVMMQTVENMLPEV